MTRTFEEAIAKLRTLPLARQEAIMEAALAWACRPGAPHAADFEPILQEFRASKNDAG